MIRSLATESGSFDIPTAIAVLLLALGMVVLGLLAWRGRIAADVPRSVMRAGPGGLILCGLFFAVLPAAELLRRAFDQPAGWWLVRGARISFVGLMTVTLAYAVLNQASWFPDPLLPPHHRKRPPPTRVKPIPSLNLAARVRSLLHPGAQDRSRHEDTESSQGSRS
jgi:hypothetical protein